MVAAARGISGERILGPFVRMASGRNSLNELNLEYGAWMHGDGWGVVYDAGRGLETYRSAVACWRDPNLPRFERARVFLLHARHASSGKVGPANVQPLAAEVEGNEVFFAHNGTVRDPLPGRRSGASDSVWLFDRFLQQASELDSLTRLRAVYRGIRDCTALNSLLLEPAALTAICLWNQAPVYYSLTTAETPFGLLVASEPLYDLAPDWMTLANGTALRVDRATGTARRLDFLPPRSNGGPRFEFGSV
jgi:predicted glutamine amidotransferase